MASLKYSAKEHFMLLAMTNTGADISPLSLQVLPSLPPADMRRPDWQEHGGAHDNFATFTHGPATQRQLPRRRCGAAPLTRSQILSWADAHCARTGAWPSSRSGSVVGEPGESWCGINAALRQGRRGLPGGETLTQLLRRERHAPERRGRPAQTGRPLLASSLRARGLSLTAIGRRLGVSRQAAWQMLQRASAWTDRAPVTSSCAVAR
jgi:hypothetical protein